MTTQKTDPAKALDEREKAIAEREKAVAEREKALDERAPEAVEEDLTPTPTQAENDAARAAITDPANYKTREAKSAD